MTDERKFPYPPDPMSEPCARYFETSVRLIGFIAFLATITERVDQVREIARKALEDVGEETDADPPKLVQTALNEFRPLLRETVLTRSVENFLTYVAELLAVVFTLRPETLRSNEEIRVDDVLQHDSMEALIDELAERRVDRLAYMGLGDLRRYLADRMGFELFENEEHFDVAARLVEYRNVIVHNRGVISRTFLRRQPDLGYALGDQLDLGDEVMEGAWTLSNVVVGVENRAAAKWGIPQSEAADDVMA